MSSVLVLLTNAFFVGMDPRRAMRDIGRERRCLIEPERNFSRGQRLKVESLARQSECLGTGHSLRIP